MTVDTYPEFAQGQTLTALELNTMVRHLRDRDTILGRLIGFGINCGLTGTVEGRTVTVRPGLAVDQRGGPLVLESETTIEVPDDGEVTAHEYPFISGTEGYSVVLRADPLRAEPPGCVDDCSGHSATLEDAVTLDIVRGTVDTERFAFLSHPLLDAEFASVNADGTVITGFAALRSLIATSLSNAPAVPSWEGDHIDAALIARLTAIDTTEDGENPASRAYKVSWLNALLLATIQLLRCRSLMAVDCARDTSHPGVVIGHLQPEGDGLVFDCSLRHDWEPPVGLSHAFVGGTCAEPCLMYRQAVESLIETYSPPRPAAPADPEPKPGGTKRCSKTKKSAAYYATRWPCRKIYQADEDYRRFRDLLEAHDLFDKMSRAELVDIDDLVGPVVADRDDFVTDPMPDQEVVLEGFLGRDAVRMKDVLIADLEQRGLPGDVRIIDQGSAGAMPGYAIGDAAAAGDTIVLSVGQDGQIVSTGRVPLSRTIQESAVAIPAAMQAAARVDMAITEIGTVRASVDERLGAFEGTVDNFGGSLQTLSTELDAIKGGDFDTTGYGTRLALLEQEVGGTRLIGERVAALEGRTSGVMTGGGRPDKVLTPELSHGISEFAETVAAALGALDKVENPNFKRYVAATKQAHAELEMVAATADHEVIAQSTIKLVDALRTAVKAAGVSSDHAREIDAQVRRFRDRIG